MPVHRTRSNPSLPRFSTNRNCFTILHTGEPAFILLPWELYCALRTRLAQYAYADTRLMHVQTIGTSRLASRFLSFERLEKTFQSADGRIDTIVIVLRRKNEVGALIQYAYYMSLIAFLQEHHAAHLEPFQPQIPEKIQERRLSLVEFRNRATQLPQHFAQERHQLKGHLPLYCGAPTASRACCPFLGDLAESA